MLLQVRPRLAGELRKEVVRVEDVVTHKLPGASMKSVRPAPTHQINIRSRPSSVSSIEVRRLHFELLNGIWCRNRRAHLVRLGLGRRVFYQVVGVDAIELDVV